MQLASDLAQKHWNSTPLFVSEGDRYAIYPWLYEAAEFRSHRGESVLEVGCGTGCDLLQFAKHGAYACGIDITEQHIALARQRCGAWADIRYGDGRHIPFPDASFDFVYSHGVVHHSDQPEAIAKEILRVLKPGARYNIQVYSLISYHPLSLMRQFGRKWKLHIENSTDPVHIDLYTAARLTRLFPNCTVKKYHFPRLPFLASHFGWYLVATGTKVIHS